MTMHKIFWGDAAGVHYATMQGDYMGAVTLADCLSRGAYAPFGVAIVKVPDNDVGEEVIVMAHRGVRGELTPHDVLTQPPSR